MHNASKCSVFFCLLFLAFALSCKSTGARGTRGLSVLFAGDIMAHTQNFSMDDFSRIWEDVRDEISEADFSFANIEAPVAGSIAFSSYPLFNMQPPYPEAAIDAGFNLISLANNHSDDKGIEGMRETLLWADGVSEKSKKEGRRVYFSGLTRRNDAGGGTNAGVGASASGEREFTFNEITWKRKKILFIAATEFLNTWTHFSYVNMIKPTDEGRADFVERIRGMNERFAPDLFIVSIHTYEKEYVMSVEEGVRKFYHELLKAGADIVVANHPHIVREVEFVGEKRGKKIRKVIMYANGNTISGQRRSLDYQNPSGTWQYTGDGQFLRLDFSPRGKGFFVADHKTTFVTCFTPTGQKSPVLKRLDEDFIVWLEKQGLLREASYYRTRLLDLQKIKRIYTWE